MPIKHIYSQITRYKAVWLWFVADSYWRFSGLVTKIILYMAGSMVMLGLALGLIYKYVNGLEQGQSLQILSMTYYYQSSIEILALVILGTALLFGSAAILKYLSGISALELGKRYEAYCMLRAASFLAISHKNESLNGWLSDSGKLLQSGPRFCGRVARLSITAVLPAMTFIATLIALAYLDVFVTIVVAMIIILSIPFLYAVNVRGARYSRALEAIAPGANQTRREIVDYCLNEPGYVSPETNKLVEFIHKGLLHDSFIAHIGRLRAVANGLLVTQIMFGIGIVVIMWVMGAEIIKSGNGWGALATYLVALRINLTSFSSTGTCLTGVNRFYPQILRYFSFVQAVNNFLIKNNILVTTGNTPRTNEQLDIPTTITNEIIEWRTFSPHKGHRISLEAPASCPDSYIRLIVSKVFNCADDPNHIYIVKQTEHSNSLCRLLDESGLDSDEDLIENTFGNLPFEFDSIENEIEKNEEFKIKSNPIVNEITSAAKSGHGFIVVEVSDWLNLDSDERRNINQALIGISLILLNRDSSINPGQNGTQFAIAVDGNGLLVQSGPYSFEKMHLVLEVLRSNTKTSSLDFTDDLEG